MAHILVVEDESHLARGIKFNLAAEGYHVTTVDNGADGLRILNESAEPVDLVILDLMLPGMSGYAVCERLRADGSDVPVLILSARTLTEDRTRGFDAGADQYLTKPFELDELISRVKGLLRRHSRRQQTAAPKPENNAPEHLPQVCTIGEATVNFQTFEVTKGTRVRQMTPLEIKLLQYLIRSNGRIVSRQELLENVWEQPGYLQTRAPDQFIRRLRKLFERNPSDPQHFVTVRDAGYRFVANRSPDEPIASGEEY
jgi:two-component system OmpR family response regulator